MENGGVGVSGGRIFAAPQGFEKRKREYAPRALRTTRNHREEVDRAIRSALRIFENFRFRNMEKAGRIRLTRRMQNPHGF